MPMNNSWFTIRLAVVGMPLDALQRALPDLQEELDAREYLNNPRSYWSANDGHIIIELSDTGLSAEHAAKGAAEEIFELVAAVITGVESYHVDVISVLPK